MRERGGTFVSFCRFTVRGRRAEVHANGALFAVEVKNETALTFSIGRPDGSYVNTRRVASQNRPALYVGNEDPPNAANVAVVEAFLKHADVARCLDAIRLARGERVTIFQNLVEAIFEPRGVDLDLERIELLVRLAELTPKPEPCPPGAIRVDGLCYDETLLPAELRHLTPYIERWARGDDVERSDLLESASPATLRRLRRAVEPHLDAIHHYVDSFGDGPVPEEAMLLATLAEAAADASGAEHAS